MIASKRGCNFSPAPLSVPCLRLPVSGASASASDVEPHRDSIQIYCLTQVLRIYCMLESQIALRNRYTLSLQVPLRIDIHLNY